MKVEDGRQLNKEFQPFVFSITVENKNELLELLGRFNIDNATIKNKALASFNLFQEFDAHQSNILKVYDYIKNKAFEYGLIK